MCTHTHTPTYSNLLLDGMLWQGLLACATELDSRKDKNMSKSWIGIITMLTKSTFFLHTFAISIPNMVAIQ